MNVALNRWLISKTWISMSVMVLGLSSCGDTSPKVEAYFENPKVVELIKAADKGNLGRMQTLVKSGVDINFRGRENFTPLYWLLVESDDLDIRSYEEMLRLGADPNAINDTGRSPLFLTVQIPETDFLKLALNYGGNPNLNHPKEPKQPTAIFHAIFLLNDKHVKILVDAGANLEKRNGSNHTPLLVASSLNQWSLVNYLLSKGADYNAKNSNGKTITWYIRNNRISKNSSGYEERKKVIEFLRDRGVEVHPWEPRK